MWLHIHWEYFISRNLVPRSVKKTKNLWRENIAFLKLEVVVDTSWIVNKIVNNFAVENGFCVKVRKTHINIIKERPDFGVKRMHPRSSNLLLFFSWILLWTFMVYLPWLCLWAVLMEVFSGPSPERSHCPSHRPSHYLFSAQCFTWAQLHFYLPAIQCPSPEAVQAVMFETSCNKKLAKILPVSKTAEARWICW